MLWCANCWRMLLFSAFACRKQEEKGSGTGNGGKERATAGTRARDAGGPDTENDGENHPARAAGGGGPGWGAARRAWALVDPRTWIICRHAGSGSFSILNFLSVGITLPQGPQLSE